MEKLNLRVEKRTLYGRKVKKLRQQGILPANLYGKKIKSQALQVNMKDFLTVFKKSGETALVQLIMAKRQKPCSVLIHNPQVNPVSDEMLHVDFRQVDLTEKVQVEIPVELIGEAPGVTKGGILIQLLNEVEVEALPADLPDKFEIDVSKLEEIGQSKSIKDLKVDKKKINVLVDNNQLIVKIEEPKKEEEEKPAEETEVEPVKEEEEKPAEEASSKKVEKEASAEKEKTKDKEDKAK